jgi:AcrR family transcriptional regulator
MNKPTRFDQRKQRTRQQLKAAAEALFLERGYDAISIQDITDRADMGRATFYLHFKDKAEVASAILIDSFEVLIRAGASVPENISVQQRDYLSFIGFFHWVQQQSRLFRALSAASGTGDVTHALGDYTLKAAFVRLHQAQLFPDVPVEAAAEFMTGGLMRITSWYIQHSDQYAPHEAAAIFYRLLHREAPPPIEINS